MFIVHSDIYNIFIIIYKKPFMPSFREGIITKYHGAQAVKPVYAFDKTVFLVVTKSQNGNIIVIRAKLDTSYNIRKIESFWLDLDPTYRVNKNHNRVELSSLESWAYGITVQSKLNKKNWIIVFNQLNTTKLRISIDQRGAATCWSYSKNTKITRLHINLKHKFLRVPKVTSVEVFGSQNGRKIRKVIKV
jgi:hypothetical protein